MRLYTVEKIKSRIRNLNSKEMWAGLVRYHNKDVFHLSQKEKNEAFSNSFGYRVLNEGGEYFYKEGDKKQPLQEPIEEDERPLNKNSSRREAQDEKIKNSVRNCQTFTYGEPLKKEV